MNETKQILISADLKINPFNYQVTRLGKPIKLPDLCYRVLVALVTQAPNPVTIDELIDSVWGKVEVSPETVKQRIALLR
jgi:DNA-binding winged helix-turn-helix (wHTH) protein